MSSLPLNAETINRMRQSFSRAFDPATSEPAVGEVPGVLSVWVSAQFQVTKVVLASDLLADDARERVQSAVVTAVNDANQQMATRHAEALRVTLLDPEL